MFRTNVTPSPRGRGGWGVRSSVHSKPRKAVPVRVSYHSSHVLGDFFDRQLSVDIAHDQAGGRPARVERVLFSVPVDFHVHEWMVLFTFLGAAAIVFVAAMIPARRATRINVVEALHYE